MAAMTNAANIAWNPKNTAGQAAPRASCQPQANIAERWCVAGFAGRNTCQAAPAISTYIMARSPQPAMGIGFGGVKGGGVKAAYQPRILATATLAEAMPASDASPSRPSNAGGCNFGAGQYSNPF